MLIHFLVLILQIWATHSHTILVHSVHMFCTHYCAHVNNMDLVFFKSWPQIYCDSNNVFFFFKIFIYIPVFIWKGCSSHISGNLSCSRDVSAVIRNADGIRVSHKMFSCCSLKWKKKVYFITTASFFFKYLSWRVALKLVLDSVNQTFSFSEAQQYDLSFDPLAVRDILIC